MLIMQELLEAHEEIDLNRDTPDDHPTKGIEEWSIIDELSLSMIFLN